MKHLRKRALSLLLAAVMAASLLPGTARAAAPDTGSEQYRYAQEVLTELNQSIPAGETAYTLSGPFQLDTSNAYFYELFRTVQDPGTGQRVTDTRYVIVPGAGETAAVMPDYDSVSETPWAGSNPSGVYIAKGVTAVGSNAFSGLTTLERVEFQEGARLTSVGSYAFSGCDKLAGPLDLSSVTGLGAYAFSGCGRLGGVTLSDDLETIPAYAFNGCGLTAVNIPANVKAIGDGAFANNSLSGIGALILPEGLETIGASAFALQGGEGTSSSGIRSLTIPSTVTEIGANAFSGRRSLAEVTVADDGEDGTELTLGAGAFGSSQFNAYAAQGSITDALTGYEYHGLLGTTFYLPADVADQFQSGINCYTGDITPMEYVKTRPATCTEEGYHEYITTMDGVTTPEGKPLEITYHYPIDPLGHAYQYKETVPASCESPGYELWVCAHDGSHTQNREPEESLPATDHSYLLTAGAGSALGGGPVTFTWECQQPGHDENRDGRKPEQVSIIVNPAALRADTGMTYGDLTLPTVTGGALSLADSVDPDALLTTGVTAVPVVFTPSAVTYAGYTGMGPVEKLTLAVQVEKAVLDFSGVRFGDCIADVDPEAAPGTAAPGIQISAAGLPDDVTAGKPLYQSGTSGGGSSETPPPINATWDGTVSVTFAYAVDKYRVDESKVPPAAEYQVAFGDGTVTITHSFRIVTMTMADLKAEAIENLEYSGQAQNTVHLSGVPNNSAIAWTWVDMGDPDNTGSGEATNTATGVDVAPLEEAGTYQVTVTVSKVGYDTRQLAPVTVTIAKAPVETPKPLGTLEAYTGALQRGLAEPGADDRYSYQAGSDLTGTNAGEYTARAALKDGSNYRWSAGDDDGDGVVEIKWSIARRPVVETGINDLYSAPVPYDGAPKTAVGAPPLATGFFTFAYNDEGSLVGQTGETEIHAFTITNARKTDAGTYQVTATIEDPDNFCWQNHPNQPVLDLGSWVISQLQIVRPTVRAKTVTYDGAAYEAENITLTHSEASGSNLGSEGHVTLGAAHVYYEGGTRLSAPPVNAGNYTVTPDLVYDSVNYLLVGGSGSGQVSLLINQAKLTLTAPTEPESDLSVTYTGGGYAVPAPEATGWQGGDGADKVADFALAYSYVFTPAGGEPGEPQTAAGGLTVSEAGSYEISVTVSDGCRNYTEAAAAEYTFTIGAASQDVVLSSRDEDWNGETKTITKTLGEAGFTVTGAGSVDKDSVMKYTCTSDTEGMLTVDESTGAVTMHKAGAAAVTVSTEGTVNAGPASAQYTVTVEKAAPAVTVNLPEGGQGGVYGFTGTALEFTATVTGAGNGAAAPTGTDKITYTFYENGDGVPGQSLGQTQPTAAGTYWVTATYGGDDNYTSRTSAAKSFTISPAQLAVEVVNPYDGETYDGLAHAAAEGFTVTGNGQTLTEGVAITYAESAGGEYTVGTMPQVRDAGAHTIYYQVSVPNYGVYTGDFTVTVKPFEVSLDGEVTTSKPYDGKDTARVAVGGTVEGAGGEVITLSAEAVYADGKDAGTGKDITVTYTLGGDGVNLANYTFNGGAAVEGKVIETVSGGEIKAKEITVVGVDARDREYDGTTAVTLIQTDSFGFAEGAIVPGDEGEVTLTFAGGEGTVDSADASDTAKTVTATPDSVVTLGGGGAGNYTVAQVVTDAASDKIDVVISRREVTLSVKDADQEGKIEKGYTGAAITLTAEIEDEVFAEYAALSQDDVAFTYEQDGEPVQPVAQGIYSVTVSLAVGAADKYSNFAIQSGACTLEITNAGLTVEPADYTGTYNGLSHDVLKGWSFESSTGSAVDKGQVAVTFQLVGADNAEEPDMDGRWISSGGFVNVSQSGRYWYQVAYESHDTVCGKDPVSVNISPAPLTLGSTPTLQKVYDSTADAAVAGEYVEGAQNGEGISVTAVTAAYDDKNVGTGKTIATAYTLTFGEDADPDNYTVSAGTVGKNGKEWTVEATRNDGVITAKPITITISNQQATYDGEPAELLQTEWSFDGGKFYESDDVDIGLSAGSAVDAKIYDIGGTASGDDAGNYNITWNKGKLTIAPRPVQVTIGGAEGYYGDSHTVTAGQTEGRVTLEPAAASNPDEGLVDGQSIYEVLPGLVLITDAGADSPVDGEYEITAQDKQYGNYQAAFTPGSYTVKPRPITIHVADHSSSYGQSIDSVLADPEPGDDYTASITGGATTGSAIVGNDDLGVTLTLTDPDAADADTYNILGTAAGGDASNYAITWTGNGDPIPDQAGQSYGKYTVGRADLVLAYADPVRYAGVNEAVDNALTLTNASAGSALTAEQAAALRAAGALTYAAEPAGAAEIDAQTGIVTVKRANTSITVTAAVRGAANYNDATAQFAISAHQAGSMGIAVSPAAVRPYTGAEQVLVAVTNPLGAAITYTVEDSRGNPVDSRSPDGLPTAVDAGAYYVSWSAEAVDGNYSDESSKTPVVVTIPKANLQGEFAASTYTFVTATDASPYDSAAENPLTVTSPNYTGDAGAYRYTCADGDVAGAFNGGPQIHIFGGPGDSTTVSVTAPGDGNYNETAFSYTLAISDQLSAIEYTVMGETDPTYDGQSHTLTVEVTAPAAGAQVRYADETGAYTLAAPPAYTNVKRNVNTGGVERYEIRFRITAPGYETVTGTAELTIRPRGITRDMFESSIGSYTYTGGKITPRPVVTDGALLLKEGADYAATWGDPNQNVGPYDETAQTGGSVTVTGMGNYGGAATATFEITPVGQNSLTAAMTRSWGVYGDSATNSTAITVSHGDADNGGHTVDGSEITITVTDSDGSPAGDDRAAVAGQTVTFRAVGQYTLHVTVSGNHSGSFTLRYTLLPAGGDEGLTLTVDGEPTPAVYTYGTKVDGDVTVKAGDTPLGADDYTLTYSYQPFAAGGSIRPVAAGTAYDPAQVFGDSIPAAGLYVVTAQASGSYTGSGTFVFLVQQRNLDGGMIGAVDDQIYTGAAIEPVVTVTYTGAGGDNLLAADDYDVSWQDNMNAGTGKIIVTAKAASNNFTGTASASFAIAPRDLSGFAVAPVGEQRYTGAAIAPPLNVTDPDRGEALIQGLDFTAYYTDNVDVGEARVTITGTGNYTGRIENVTFRIVATVSSFDLALDRTAWTWGESGPADVKVSYTSGGTEAPLTMGADYVLAVDGAAYTDPDAALAALGALEPGTHAVTAQGMQDTGYAGLNDTVIVTVSKIRPVLSVSASPAALSGAGTVTLTLKGENLPADAERLPDLLTASASGGTAPDLTGLTWAEEPAGTWTAELALPNASSTYTFTLAFTPSGAAAGYYESARATGTVVTAQHTSSGGGGGGGQATAFTITASAGAGGAISPAGTVAVARGGSQSFAVTPAAGYEIADLLVDGDSVGAASSYTFSNVTKNHTITVSFSRTEEIADPDETGVSGWLNTTDHMAYMQGYPGSLFGPDDNMTRAEAAQMFYNLLLNKDVAVTASFTDVEEDAWYSRAVNVLATLGMLNGVGGEQFAPERSITRAEFTAMAVRFARLETGGDNPFSDVHEHEWFYGVVVGSVRYGWINGYPDGTFRPYDTISRAEAAAATNRMLGRAADRDYVDAHAGALTRFDDVGTGYWAYYEIMEAANGHDYRRTDGFEHWTARF